MEQLASPLTEAVFIPIWSVNFRRADDELMRCDVAGLKADVVELVHKFSARALEKFRAIVPNKPATGLSNKRHRRLA
jgi:hypothetical protein